MSFLGFLNLFDVTRMLISQKTIVLEKKKSRRVTLDLKPDPLLIVIPGLFSILFSLLPAPPHLNTHSVTYSWHTSHSILFHVLINFPLLKTCSSFPIVLFLNSAKKPHSFSPLFLLSHYTSPSHDDRQ